jgi:hypothetical protein
VRRVGHAPLYLRQKVMGIMRRSCRGCGFASCYVAAIEARCAAGAGKLVEVVKRAPSRAHGLRRVYCPVARILAAMVQFCTTRK